MKNKLSILAVLIVFSTVAFAQSEGKNITKVNISSFALKGFGLQYERQISKKWTAALAYSNIPESGIAFQSTIEKLVDDPNVQVGSFRLGNSVFTPELRFYVGKKGAFHGFYLAPYARISNYTVSGPVNYSATTTQQKTVIFNGKFNSTTGGLMLGSQFKLSNLFYLDWWIIGASVGGGNGNLAANTPLTPIEQQNLKQVLDAIDIPLIKTESTVNNNGAIITTKGSAGVRGLGLNLGVRF